MEMFGFTYTELTNPAPCPRNLRVAGGEGQLGIALEQFQNCLAATTIHVCKIRIIERGRGIRPAVKAAPRFFEAPGCHSSDGLGPLSFASQKFVSTPSCAHAGDHHGLWTGDFTDRSLQVAIVTLQSHSEC